MTSNNFVGPESSWFWTAIQALAVVITLPLIYRQVLIARRATMITACESLAEKWNSPRLVAARKATSQSILEGKSVTDPVCSAAANKILMFFEEVGLLIEMNVIEERFIWERLSYVATRYGSLLGPLLSHYRSVDNDPTVYDKCEMLIKRMTKIERQRGGRKVEFTRELLQGFFREEVENLKDG